VFEKLKMYGVHQTIGKLSFTYNPVKKCFSFQPPDSAGNENGDAAAEVI
jgi:hypothetical protein